MGSSLVRWAVIDSADDDCTTLAWRGEERRGDGVKRAAEPVAREPAPDLLTYTWRHGASVGGSTTITDEFLRSEFLEDEKWLLGPINCSSVYLLC